MSPTNGSLHIERGVALRAYNTFGLPAVAHTLVRVGSDAEVRRVVDHPELGRAKKLILGAGSNLTYIVSGLVSPSAGCSRARFTCGRNGPSYRRCNGPCRYH